MVASQHDIDKGRLTPKAGAENDKDDPEPDNTGAGAGPYGTARTDLSKDAPGNATGPKPPNDLDTDGVDKTAGGEYLDDKA